ncbi:MAG: large conductance mechanosensitive channel protein MscL [Eubacteriaceae bacterium]|jgi:large conductance mechanosensitive channel|nr:large conductance mechanosensitive channel protein MscL [Eubacteriaceae bacterium]
MWNDFKNFAFKGNVMDLAVAVVLGAAFSAIINALVADIIMPIIGVIIGGVDFTELVVTVGNASIKYGLVIQQVIDFFLIAFSLFIVIRCVNKMNKRMESLLGIEKKEEPAKPTQEELLTEIRDMMKEEKKSA